MNGDGIFVAAVQMNSIPLDIRGNMRAAGLRIEEAVAQGAKLVVLPELFNTGYRVEENDAELAEAIPGPTTERLAVLAKKYGIYISASILERGEASGLVYDTAFLLGPGGIVGTYRKTHLWDLENVRFAKGDRMPVFETPIGNIGLQICYEIGFPEGARRLALQGADLLLYPSAFGEARLYAWDLATRSRALENGAYLIASNRSGVEKQVTAFCGHSRIVDPQGQVLSEAKQENEVIVASIELASVTRQRRAIPYLRDLNRSLFYK